MTSSTASALELPEARTAGDRIRAAGRWLVRGRATAAVWERPALLGLLAATAVLYFWNLSINGWANSFYAAAVQAGSVDWQAFFYGSSDAANAITVDKPPASLWLMALSVRIFGLSPWSILAPEALLGVASVLVLYLALRRRFSAGAALLAGSVLALTPVATLMFRFDNPDALLVLLMTLAAYFTIRGIEDGRIRWMLWAGAMIGLGFLTKQLQAFILLPPLAIVYVWAAPHRLVKRLLYALAALGAVIVSAGWWVAIVELVPAAWRPYIGGSQSNSFLELTFGYNGFGRITGNETGSVGSIWGSAGILRLFGSDIAGQVAWLLPAALALTVIGYVLLRRAPRTSVRRATLTVFAGWMLVTALFFSFMAGIFHAYYTIALAPAIAAVVGIGAELLWTRRAHILARVVTAIVVLGAAATSFWILSLSSSWLPWLRWVVLGLGIAGSALLLIAPLAGRRGRILGFATGALLVGAISAGPLAFSIATVGVAHSGSIPSAGPAVTGTGFGGARPNFGGTGTFGPRNGGAGAGGTPPTAPGATGARGAGGAVTGGGGGLLNSSSVSSTLAAALSANATSYTWIAATVGSNNAAGYQLATQLPVMAIGGFNGSDPSPTLAQFQQDVAQGRIHYFIGSSLGGGAQNGGSDAASQIKTWVAANFTATTVDGVTLYDLTAPTSGAISGSTAAGS